PLPSPLDPRPLHDALPISIDPQSDGPVIAQGPSVAVTMDEDGTPTPFSLTLSGSDPDNQTLTWSASALPSNGAISLFGPDAVKIDRKSTRLNSSHVKISYA